MTVESAITIGFCWSFRGCTPEEGLPRLREFGFEGIELWPDYLREWGTERWASALRETEMRCLQLCPYFNFVHGESKIEESRRMLCEYLEVARLLACNRLRTFTGPPWGDGVVGSREASQEQWQSSITTLREFCEVAAEQGVELCMECHAGSLMEDAPSTLRLIEGVDHPNLTVNLQLPLRDENWQTSLHALAPYTTHIHIHNWENGLDNGPLTFLAEGAFDWKPVVRYLLGAGRSVCLSVEHTDHGKRHDSWETARRDGPFLCDLRKTVEPTR
jgi:sugar phosphate isomerase/epimerase